MGDTSVHAVILAAGRGRRLWPLTKDRPKSLIDLGDGATILGRQLEVLSSHRAVGQVTVVTGHRADVIEEFTAGFGADVDTCFNPFFGSAGPLGSLWAVHDRLLEDDFVVMNGDTLFHGEVLDALIAAGADGSCVALVASTTDQFAPDDVRVATSAGRQVHSVGKGVDGADARSAGILLVRGDSARSRAHDVLSEMMREEANLAPDVPWHSWVDAMARRPPGVRVVLVDDVHWSEVDIHPELDELRSELASKLK